MKISLAGENSQEFTKGATKQLSTFFLDGRLYGIDVMKVQEVTKPLPITVIHRAPPFVKGLINLRGQIATAIGLRELFGLSADHRLDKMTVVCRFEDIHLSLLVDSIGDVVEVAESNFENTPSTVDPKIRAFMQGVYKTEASILSVVSLEYIIQEIDKQSAA